MFNDVNEIIYYTVFVCRNIKNIPFPSRLRIDEGRNLADKISKSLLENEKYKFKKVNLWEESKEKCILYLENLIISKETYNNRKISAFLMTEDQKIIILINELNHIKIIIKDKIEKFQQLSKTSNEILDMISKSFDFEYDDSIGYLTSNVEKVGTGVTAASILHLPMLSKSGDVNEIIQEYKKQEILISDVFTDGITNIADIYLVENKITLGIKQEEIFSDVEAITQQIVMREKKLKNTVLETDPYEIYDMVFRAKAILMNARKISCREVLKNTSMLRLGIEMKIIKDIQINQITKMILAAKYNSIRQQKDDNLKINIDRANYIRSVFSDV